MIPNRAKTKANPAVKYGLEILIFPPLKAITPPPKMMMAMFAPNTEALVTPNVEGEAITLLLIDCMMTPDMDKAIPTKIAATILGNLIFWTMMILVSSPIPNKPFKPSIKEIWLEPMNMEAIAKTTKRMDKTDREMILFCFKLVIAFSNFIPYILNNKDIDH